MRNSDELSDNVSFKIPLGVPVFSNRDVIDFSPIHITDVVHDGSDLIIRAPSQPCYNQQVATGSGRRVPHFNCELRIERAAVCDLSGRLPFETDDWDVSFTTDSHSHRRACFLPWDFVGDGPVRLVIRLDASPVIDVTGDRICLLVQGPADWLPEWYA